MQNNAFLDFFSRAERRKKHGKTHKITEYLSNTDSVIEQLALRHWKNGKADLLTRERRDADAVHTESSPAKSSDADSTRGWKNRSFYQVLFNLSRIALSCRKDWVVPLLRSFLQAEIILSFRSCIWLIYDTELHRKKKKIWLSFFIFKLSRKDSKR